MGKVSEETIMKLPSYLKHKLAAEAPLSWRGDRVDLGVTTRVMSESKPPLDLINAGLNHRGKLLRLLEVHSLSPTHIPALRSFFQTGRLHGRKWAAFLSKHIGIPGAE